jgi:hypothetical protein
MKSKEYSMRVVVYSVLILACIVIGLNIFNLLMLWNI